MAADGKSRSVRPLDKNINYSDEEEGFPTRRTSTTTEPPYTNDMSSDDEHHEEPFDSIDYQAYQLVHKYLDHDTRRSRAPKKAKDKDAYLRQKQMHSKHSANSSRRTSRDNQQYPGAGLEVPEQQQPTSDGGSDAGSDGQKRTEIHRRKQQERAIMRDAKFETTDCVADGPDPNTPPAFNVHISIPAPQQESVKIDLPNPFRSLNSRPVVPKDPALSSGTATPLMTPAQECPKDRCDFYEIFSLLIRIGNHERKATEERTFSRQVRHLERSHEEQIWQNKLNDVVWLELRAWHNGRSPEAEDFALCNERERIAPILKEVMKFRFHPRSHKSTESPPNDSLFAISALTPTSAHLAHTPAIFDELPEDELPLPEPDNSDSTGNDAFVIITDGIVGNSLDDQHVDLRDYSTSITPTSYAVVTSNDLTLLRSEPVVPTELEVDVTIKRGERRQGKPRRPRLDLSKAKLDGVAFTSSPKVGGGRAFIVGSPDPVGDSGTFPLPQERGDWDPGYACGGLCNVFCPACLVNQSDAMKQVEQLLDKLEEVGRLYPSSRALAKHWSEVSSPEFNDRVKTMCLYYNMVTDLRQKIVTLGKLLASLGDKSLPWPTFDGGSSFDRLFSTESSILPAATKVEGETEISDDEDDTVHDELPSSENCDDVSKSGAKCVRFLPPPPPPPRLLVAQNDNGLMHTSLDSGIGLAQPSSSSGSSTPSGNLTPNPWNRPAKPGGPESEGQGSGSNDPPWTWNSTFPVSLHRHSPSLVSGRPGTPVMPGSDNNQPPSPAPSCSSITGAVFNRSLSELSVDNTQMPPYRRYVDKLLKQKGLRKLLQRLTQLIENTLFRARHSLEKRKPPALVTSPDLEHLTEEPLSLPISQLEYGHCSKWDTEDWISELAYYGVWGEYYSKMGLPSYRALYLFLLQIPLEIMHECLQLRLEQQPENPSSLSIRQLMKECKEAIKASVIIRQKYFRMNRVVLLKHELDKLEQNLTDFDDNVKRMLQSYLRYLQSWVQMLLKSPQQTQKDVLEEEWTFVKVFSRYVQRGEALASEVFCSMASNMLASSGHYLETELDNCKSKYYDHMTSDQDVSTPTSNRRLTILMSCRNFKDMFHETRKRALKAIAFSKMLRKDLEIAAEFRIITSTNELMDKLQATNHVRLIAPHSSNFILLIPEHIKDNRPYLGQLLSMTYGHEHSAAPDNTKTEGYLIILHCDNCGNVPGTWKGLTQAIEPTAEITITLSQLNVEGLLFVVNHSSQLGTQRKIFQKAVGCNVRVVKEFTSCNQSIADSLIDLKKEALALRDKITEVISNVEENLDMENIGELDDGGKANLQSSCRELLHQCYKFGFEYQKEITRLVTGESRSKLGPGLILFARNWMRFVSQKCERGRGVRPRWANQGLDFLMTACEPVYIKQLPEEEFMTLKMDMNECITHLIGSVETRSYAGGSGSRSHSPTPNRSSQTYRKSASYEPLSQYPRSVSTVSSKSEPTPTKNMSSSWHPDLDLKEKRKSVEVTLEDDLESSMNLSEDGMPMDRVRRAVRNLESEREKTLLNEGMIGQVRDVNVETTVQISARRVTFHWQRGIKIGQGRFGKVYAAVNSDNGELMALKEIHLQPNDHKTIKDVADELKIFEGIRHPYLVRYFGVEIHREEMFIFMEYCSCGTLESAAQIMLPEVLIRKYTRQLLEAVNVLHEHGIVHRDIKGANIFLTSDGNLKLGDFGCCIKLKNHTTMPGELNSFVGTQAFMAPEVFTKSVTEGHGRAADIWSVGCVVIEMATGKRPWHELENHYQIMFKVGTGVMPDVPSSLSDEGQEFLSHCFQFEPKDRWTASRLLDSPFTKVDSEDEFQSMTFLHDALKSY